VVLGVAVVDVVVEVVVVEVVFEDEVKTDKEVAYIVIVPVEAGFSVFVVIESFSVDEKVEIDS
jgi:hypothetical protein